MCGDESYNSPYFTAFTLKTDLMKKAIDGFESGADGSALEELCCFVATLMHSELTTVDLPALNSIPRDTVAGHQLIQIAWCKVSFSAANSALSLGERNSNFETLMDAMVAKCHQLKRLHVRTLKQNKPLYMTEGSHLAGTFFRALPQLASLQIVKLDMFCCDDWVLQQFGAHGTNLVYGF